LYRVGAKDGPARILEACRHAEGEIVVLADAQTILDASWVREAVAMVAAAEVDAVLDPAGDLAASGLLAPGLRGAVLSRRAIEAAASGGAFDIEAWRRSQRVAVVPRRPGVATGGLQEVVTSRPALAPAVDQGVPGRRFRLAQSRPGRALLLAADILHRRVPGLRGRIGRSIAALAGARPFIDGPAYLAWNPDVAEAQADPYLHYLRHGFREGRNPRPDGPTVAAAAADRHPASPGPVAPAASPRTPPLHRDARLLILHALGGGTRRYAELIRDDLARQGIRAILAWGQDDSMLVLEGAGETEELRGFELPRQIPEATALLRRIGVTRVEVMHAMGLETQLVPLLASLDMPYGVTFLDYHLVARHPHLAGPDGYVAPFDAEEWLASLRRPEPHPVLAGAAELCACSQDLATRVQQLAPGLSVRVTRPPEKPDPARFRVTPYRPPAAEEMLRILFLGDLVRHKGSEILLDTAALAAARGAPLEFHMIGRMHEPVAFARQSPATLHLHGAFDAARLTELVCAVRPHLAWFPAMVPETHGFALSDAMLLGLPIMARGLGAYPERLRGRADTCVVSPEDDNGAHAWLRRFLELRSSSLRSDRAKPEHIRPPDPIGLLS
ncbi:MAG TPA: glycosyltransferase, partial [Acetobacteraceae bacterium]|nr:glycosyltransferase [Acetobacteraceae bacterium]